MLNLQTFAKSLTWQRTKTDIAELNRIKSDLESSIKKRVCEISSLNESLTEQGIEKNDIELQRRELSSKLQSVDNELVNEKSERENLLKLKKKVEDEVAECISGALQQFHQAIQRKPSFDQRADLSRKRYFGSTCNGSQDWRL